MGVSPWKFICADNTNVGLEIIVDSDTFIGSGVYKKKNNAIKNFSFSEISPTEVPEFGVVTGAAALLTSGGSFLVLRRMRKA